MVENIICDGCNKELEETENIYECGNCDKIYCEKCKEGHKCLKKEDCDEHANEICNDCGNCEEDMYKCPQCDYIYCDDCIDEHIEDCAGEKEFTEWGFNEYIKEKVTEGLK